MLFGNTRVLFNCIQAKTFLLLAWLFCVPIEVVLPIIWPLSLTVISPYGVLVNLALIRVPTVVLVATKNPTPIIIKTIIRDTATAAIVPLLLAWSVCGDVDNLGCLGLAGGGFTNSLLGLGGPSGWLSLQVYWKREKCWIKFHVC